MFTGRPMAKRRRVRAERCRHDKEQKHEVFSHFEPLPKQVSFISFGGNVYRVLRRRLRVAYHNDKYLSSLRPKMVRRPSVAPVAPPSPRLRRASIYGASDINVVKLLAFGAVGGHEANGTGCASLSQKFKKFLWCKLGIKI